MNLSLEGRRALVCGASQGIGLAAAQELASLGARITLLARNEESLKSALATLPEVSSGSHDFAVADFSNSNNVSGVATDLVKTHEFDILINNTGGPAGGPISEANTDAFIATFEQHLLCNHKLVQALLPGMRSKVLVPIQEENEFHNNILDIVDSLKLDQSYVDDALEAYGSEITPFVITRAISCFERTLISGGSPFDRYLSGEENALSSEELNGLQIFESKGCVNCHSGQLLSEFEIINNGLYEEYEDPGLFHLTNDPNDIGKFKVPSLRNVTMTHPYMYDGSLATLDDVLDHYVSGGSNHPNKSELITPIELNEEERADLKAFLNALTDQGFIDWASEL